jgi:hypothetical protein
LPRRKQTENKGPKNGRKKGIRKFVLLEGEEKKSANFARCPCCLAHTSIRVDHILKAWRLGGL